MDAYESLRTSLASAFSQIGTQLAEYAPKLLGAALLLLLGWLIARLLRGLAVKVMHLLELVLHRLWRGPAGRAALLPSASVEVVGTILFWVVIVFFAAAATHVLGLDAFSSWLKDLMAYLPTLVAGLLIILAGVLLSGFARDLTMAALATLPDTQRSQIGRLVQGAHPPLVEEGDPVAPLGLVQVARGEEDRDPGRDHLVEDEPEVAARDGVHAEGGLVQEEDRGVVNERA